MLLPSIKTQAYLHVLPFLCSALLHLLASFFILWDKAQLSKLARSDDYFTVLFHTVLLFPDLPVYLPTLHLPTFFQLPFLFLFAFCLFSFFHSRLEHRSICRFINGSRALSCLLLHTIVMFTLTTKIIRLVIL